MANALDGLDQSAINILRRVGRELRIDWPRGPARTRDGAPFGSLLLLDRGLIERHSSPKGRRITATITDAGRALLPAIEQHDTEAAKRSEEIRARQAREDRIFNAAPELLTRLAVIVATNDAFRKSLPAGWEGDPLNDACEEAKPLLARLSA